MLNQITLLHPASWRNLNCRTKNLSMLYLCILLLETRVKVGGAKSDECPFFQNVGKGPKTSFVSNKTYVACAMFHCLTTKWIQLLWSPSSQNKVLIVTTYRCSLNSESCHSNKQLKWMNMSITKLAKLSWRSHAHETTCKSMSKTHER